MDKTWFRGSERQPLQLPVRLNGLDADAGSAALVNLGLSGAAIVTHAPLVPGAEFELELESPNLWDPLRIRSRAVWCEERRGSYVTGLSFTLENPAIVGLVADLISAGRYD